MSRPGRSFSRVVWARRWWAWSSRPNKNLRFSIASIVIFILVLRWPRWRKPLRCGPKVRAQNPFAALYRNDTSKQCQETLYQPFLAGCPESCESFRPEVKNDEILYRLTLEWYLGQPRLESHPPLPTEGAFYESGYNYESCSTDFVKEFGRASDELESSMSKRYPGLIFKTQARMHVSLAYFCCLRQEEAYHVREIMRSFVKGRSFLIPAVTFERIECWKERFNSITNIVVVDNASQKRLLKLLDGLVEMIENVGIPIKVSRLTQMPFHATLLGIQFGDKYSLDPEHNIDRTLNASFQTLQNINQSWKRPCFDIQHDPKFSDGPIQHTHLKT